MMFNDYLTWTELLAECGCTRRTIVRWQSQHGFPRAILTPKGHLFKKAEITAWLRRQERDQVRVKACAA